MVPNVPARDPLYRGERFPAEIISHAVWLYYRFHLSHRDVEELLAERGVQVSYEAIRLWCRKFGPAFAAALRRRRARPGDKWHLDEVQLKSNGRRHWLWRAVDQDGLVLDILVQARRDQHAADRFLRRVLEFATACVGHRGRGTLWRERGGGPHALAAEVACAAGSRCPREAGAEDVQGGHHRADVLVGRRALG